MSTYKGFSTVNKQYPPFTLTDEDLVKTDILNEFNTRKGERFMLPEFGSRIHDLIMDPLDNFTKELIMSDVKIVIGHEPRVRLIGSPSITETDHTVEVGVDLYFVLQDTAEHLLISFTKPLSEE